MGSSPDKIDEGKTYKEYYNHSQRDCYRFPSDSSRVELLEKIGELKFEEVLYKPPTRKKRTKKKVTNKFLSGKNFFLDSFHYSFDYRSSIIVPI